MTLPTSGSLSLSDVMTELRVTNPGRAYPISLGDSDVRALAGVPSGAISLSNLYGKSSYIAMSGSVPDRSGSAPSNPTSNYTTQVSISVVLTGGQAPFSYAWSHVSGDGTVTAANTSSTFANFTVARFSEPGEVQTQVVQCVVTDSTSATLTRTGTVTLTLD
jgi:hypothetical protein